MRIRAIFIRIVRQFVRDKRSLALIFIAPMLILSLMSWVFNGDAYKPKLGLVNVPSALQTILEKQGATLTPFDAAGAEEALQHGDVDAVLSVEGTFPAITPKLKLEGSDPSKTKAVMLLFQKTLQDLNPAASALRTSISYLHGSETSTLFDWIGPVLVGVFAFFFVFILAGVAFLRERTGGTLERLLATPLRRWEIVVGYVLGFGLFTMLQACLIAWFAVDILDMVMVGPFGFVLLVTLLLALSALTLGTFLSAFAANEFQMIQFIPLVVVPQIFFAGLFPVESMAQWLRWLSVVMPLTYGADALRAVMVKGGGWADIAKDIYVLLGFSFAFMAANVLALRKHRKL